MKKCLTILSAFFLVLNVVAIANATTIVSLIGDKDGFGIGATNGSSFNWTAIGSGDGDGTDVWRYGDYSYTHTYDLSGLGTLTSAELEIFTGGQGWYALTQIYIDSTLVGTLKDGDFSEDGGTNYAWLDTFDLTSYLALLDGATSITVNTYLSGDGWVLDYSQLTISDDSAPVPEPATMLLLGSGLLGLAGFRKRFKK